MHIFLGTCRGSRSDHGTRRSEHINSTSDSWISSLSVWVHQMKIEPIVNYALRDRVLEIKARSENQEKVLEVVGLTDLWTKALAMNDEELIVCALAALHKCPDLVFAAMASDRAELMRKGKNDD